MSELFNARMTYAEVNAVFFSAISRVETDEERNRIMDEYKSVCRSIVKKDFAENDGKLTSYRFPEA